MIQENYFTNNEDLQLHFSSLINWEEIINEYENGFLDSQEYQKTKNPFFPSVVSRPFHKAGEDSACTHKCGTA